MTAGFALIAGEHPEAFAAYAAYVDEVWSSPDLPVGTLELCRRRIALLLGAPLELGWSLGELPADVEVKASMLAQWPRDPAFSELDRACLAFAEQFLMDVQALDDPTAEAVRVLAGDAGLVTLAIGVGLAEGLTRAAVVLGGPVQAGTLTSLRDRVEDAG